MAELDLIWMSLCIFLPSLFALVLLFFPKGTEEYMRWWTLLGTAFTLVISLFLFIDFQRMMDFDTGAKDKGSKTSLTERVQTMNKRAGNDDPRESGDMVSRFPWISRRSAGFYIDYFVGVDGISMPLILLTTVITFLSMIASWGIEKHVKGYCALFLLLETGVIGTFLALDFFLFYIFWEVMLLPMYFLIGVWGGPRREYAAIKFFLYTLFGSVFILIALLGFYFTDVRDFADKRGTRTGEVHTFDLVTLSKAGRGALDFLNAAETARQEAVNKSDDPATVEKAVRAAQTAVAAKIAAVANHPVQDVENRLRNQVFFSPT